LTKTFIFSDMLSRAGAINAVSLRVEGMPDYFSMRRNGNGKGEDCRAKNRQKFFQSLGFNELSVARAGQVHGDNITFVESSGSYPDTDGFVTRNKNLLLAISVADCVPILVADNKSQTIAAVHAGWRGTARRIAGEVIDFMVNELSGDPKNIFAFIGPSAGVCCYEVGEEVAKHFHDGEIMKSSNPGKFMLDLKAANFSQLIDHGVFRENIEVSEYCTIHDTNFHSFRRDGTESGRMLAVIGLKKGIVE